MGGDELRRRIRPPSALAQIIVIEQRDLADSLQPLFPRFHPGMGRWRTGPWRKEKTRSHRWKLDILPDSANRLLTCFADLFRQARMPAGRGPSRTGEWLEAYLPLVSAACSRSRNGVCASFNLRRASSSEKKQARSTSGKFCIFPERGGHSISNVFERHSNSPGKSPSNAQA